MNGPDPAAASSVTRGDLIGDYRLEEPLGRGGFGRVFRARHRESGEEVALKTVRAPQRELATSLRREIRALARATHPGIVTIVAHGLDRGWPWYAMELVRGETLNRRFCRPRLSAGPTERLDPTEKLAAPDDSTTRVYSREPGTGSDPADPPWIPDESAPSAAPPEAAQIVERLTVLRRVCEPLAYIHGEGIVHRDLKPDNILVRPDGRPVIVDFGLMEELAGSVSREALEARGTIAGSLHYMAPEQAGGGIVDARADLYSLGCILYLLMTGRHPFEAETPAGLIGLHRSATPTPPSQVVAHLPPEIDTLVMKLLEKEPARRLGFAEDVAAALAKIGAEDGVPTGRRPRPYLYRSVFTGRAAAQERLRERLSRLDRGQGGLVLIGGESGVGKTRLVNEATAEANRAGYRRPLRRVSPRLHRDR